MKPCFRKIRRHFFGQLNTLLQNMYFHHVVNPHMFLLFSFPGAFTTYSKNTYSPFKLLFWNMFLSFFLTMVTETYNVYTYIYIYIFIIFSPWCEPRFLSINMLIMRNIFYVHIWRFPEIGVPQIIQVMDDHDLVLKPLVTCGSPISRNPLYTIHPLLN